MTDAQICYKGMWIDVDVEFLDMFPRCWIRFYDGNTCIGEVWA